MIAKWEVKSSTTPIGDTGDYDTIFWLEKEGWRNIYLNSDNENEYEKMAQRLNTSQPLPDATKEWIEK